MKEAQATCPQHGNKLWTEVYAPRSRSLPGSLGRGALPRRGSSRREDTLESADRGPLRGGTGKAVLEASRPAKAGREAAGFAQAGPPRAGRPPASPGRTPGPGELDKGAQTPERARKRPAPSASPADGATRSRQKVSEPSGPGTCQNARPSRSREAAPVRREPIWSWSGEGGCASSSPTHAPRDAKAAPRRMLKLGWRGPARRPTPPGEIVGGRKGSKPPMTRSPRGDSATARARVSGDLGAVLADRGGWQTAAAARGKASRERAAPGTPAVEGALDRGRTPPLAGRRLDSALAGLRGGVDRGQALATRGEGARQRASAARIMTSLLADNAGRKERCAESAVRGSTGPRRAWSPATGGDQRSAPKLGARRQARLRSIMPQAMASAGQAAWKLAFAAKAAEGGDSRARRSEGCAWCKSVAEAG